METYVRHNSFVYLEDIHASNYACAENTPNNTRQKIKSKQQQHKSLNILLLH